MFRTAWLDINNKNVKAPTINGCIYLKILKFKSKNYSKIYKNIEYWSTSPKQSNGLNKIIQEEYKSESRNGKKTEVILLIIHLV